MSRKMEPPCPILETGFNCSCLFSDCQPRRGADLRHHVIVNVCVLRSRQTAKARVFKQKVIVNSVTNCVI